MSYDISFRVKVEGVDAYVDVGCNANITWNVGDIIRKSTGLKWESEGNNGLVKDVITSIINGRKDLINHPHKYKKYEPKNGWGSVESTIGFFEEIINTWEMLKKDSPELANIATFWIT